MIQSLSKTFLEAQELLKKLASDSDFLEKYEQACGLLQKCYREDKKTLSCGNGGSTCDALHYAEELTGRFRKDRRPLPAIALCDPAHMTCVSNDFGYDQIFSRLVEAYGKPGDGLIAISTSGNSANVIHAVEVAKKKDMFCIGLLGKSGGKLKELVDIALVVPTEKTERIQEIHIKLIHNFIESIEMDLFPDHYSQDLL